MLLSLDRLFREMPGINRANLAMLLLSSGFLASCQGNLIEQYNKQRIVNRSDSECASDLKKQATLPMGANLYWKLDGNRIYYVSFEDKAGKFSVTGACQKKWEYYETIGVERAFGPKIRRIYNIEDNKICSYLKTGDDDKILKSCFSLKTGGITYD